MYKQTDASMKNDKPYKVKCLDTVYDPEHGFLVLLLLFIELGEKRIMPWHKNDFRLKGHEFVPDIEMIKLGKMLKGRTFKISILDDPNRKHLTNSQQMHYACVFNKNIKEELDKVTVGLTEEEGQITRKLFRMGQEGKLNFAKMYEKESNLRNRLGL